ncbi:MAG: hypothetical protein HW383_770 [Candidatus Magasanikbacteria bacterium]|nr:hypothetical protein [Candidatus Magasanikbacteria bacterium]
MIEMPSDAAHNAPESDAEEKNGQDNGGAENNFFSAAFGGVDVAGTAKSGAESRAFLLDENASGQEHSQDNLEDIQKH